MSNKISFVNFPIGNACNLQCKFCYNDSSRKNKQYFEDIEVLKLKLKSYNFKGQKKINLIGGEPLMYPDFFKLLDYLKSNNYIVRIVTNGVQLGNKKFVIKFLKYKNLIESINISIHSHDLNLEDEITGRKGVLNKKILGIKLLQKYGYKFRLSLVINNLNIEKLFKIIIYYKICYKVNIGLQGMLTYKDFSRTNIEMIPNYTKIIHIISKIIKKNIFIPIIHWIPLCIHYQINIISSITYEIREFKREYLYSAKVDGSNLLYSHIKGNYIGNNCKKCYAFKKFCFGPGKIYVKKYGYSEFISLNKNDVNKLIIISHNNYIIKKRLNLL